jgi:protein arginine kinase activator
MLCQICKKRPANVHVVKAINGVKSELHVCDECAKENELGVGLQMPGMETPFSFSNLLAGFIDFTGGGGTIPNTIQQGMKCPECGLEYNEFRNTGRFGCSGCYEAFGQRLEPLFKRIHGNTQHAGKVPKRTGGIIRIKRDIEKMKYELKRAIENEEFEKAAELRDRIRNLESKEGDK